MTVAGSALPQPAPTTSASAAQSPRRRPPIFDHDGATDWTNTSSLITPNFGDYTDNTSVGTTTYYTWSDGRLGVPQPFVDHH